MRLSSLPLFSLALGLVWNMTVASPAQTAPERTTTGQAAVAATPSAPGLNGDRSDIFPLSQVKAGMHGVGRTVFNGSDPAEFQVDILGVIDDLGPRQAVILARLSGGPLAETGVMEGMSGSPVYIDGKLVGAVALGFPFAKDAIAGITPIEQMLDQEQRASAVVDAESKEVAPFAASEAGWKIISTPGASSASSAPRDPGSLPPAGVDRSGGSTSLPELQTPIAFVGFTDAAIGQFLPQWRAMGLSASIGGAMQASPGGGASLAAMHKLGAPGDLHPGDMISVQLLRGDMGVSADGTVTAIRNGEVYAFGHRFMSTGDTSIPFARAKVLATVAGLQSSFKISQADVTMGVIHQDLSQGVYGTLGEDAPMIPVRIHVHNTGQPVEDYVCEMVDHRFLGPLLLNMALYSTLDATERGVGSQTLTIQASYAIAGGAHIRTSSLFSGDMNGPAVAAAAATRPLSLMYSSGLPNLRIDGVDFDVSSAEQKRVLTVEQVWSDRREVAPGEGVVVTAILRADDGTEVERLIPLTLPETLPAGALTVLVGNGDTVAASGPSAAEAAVSARDLAQLEDSINRLPRNNQLYLRVTRADPGFVLDGEQFPFPPPSLARALAADPAVDADVHSMQNSTVLDYHSDPLPYVIDGMKTIRLTVRER